ncbi:MAG: DUF3604 domain-containing protein [Xanthomonadales bacterium]|nr:DUF3604 domain-containing protein [Xanthomonadales bacterium]NIN60633.1 DUF3604 domain-containing protein [Xanthomonadales bacterium]NIN75985.1 DUF3604 domain-containing protein [Xanthomonadales bacterium]NIO13038.1 DUF3604 domain-containing protein [Xanthomonadales bacterium]NIP13026.1 DUF3604 domain-containing protein [Xanthomonadales bacterium]
MSHRYSLLFVFVVALLWVFNAGAQEPPPDPESLERVFPQNRFSPYADRSFPTRVYWGDTHLHTSLSMDAGAFGARLGPEDAYRFARGEQVTSSTGVPARLSRPLDWLVVADHSDNMGLFTMLYEADPLVTASEIGAELSRKVRAGGREGVEAALYIIEKFSDNTLDPELQILPGTKPYEATWHRIIKAAEDHNDPGQFTAFIGYEWTSLVEGNNMHRVVIYRDGKAEARQVEPFTMTAPYGSPDPRDLWQWMATYEERTGGDVLALAHNGNLANGIMFPVRESYQGKKVNREYAQTRIKWEPLYEITQIKGDGEAHPFLSPNDEFADYENWDKGNLSLSAPKQESMLQYEYAREALKNGLLLEEKLGINPYKFGVVGSTDSHTGLATAQEDNFFGKHSGTEPGPQRAEHPVGCFGEVCVMGWEQVASGLAAVWARENTREAIFDAMERKETYATTGSRMLVRFFGGWEFTAQDAQSRNPGVLGYGKGVPMGGDLRARPEGTVPSFLVYALRDPIGANLDRIQIVKGWLDRRGRTHEKVYDVAWSGDRQAGEDGKLPAVGSTVDVANATYLNTIGASELIAVWQDPDFDPNQRAFYYARVIEIPTPRWTAYEAQRFGIEMPDEVPMVTQERAYTSPIWYTP